MTDAVSRSSFVLTQRGWPIWLTGLAFLLFQYTLEMSSGVLIQQLGKSFSLSAFQAGALSASYFYIYLLLQIPAGILADRFGARIILSLGSFMCALGCLLFANADTITTAQFGRMLMGGGGALSYVGIIYLVQHWFHASRFALMVGLIESFGLISTMFGDVYMADFVANVGWRHTMQLAGLISSMIACACWLIIRDTPTSGNKVLEIDTTLFFNDLKRLLKNTTVWLNGIYNGLLYSIVTVYVALWGIPFMSLKYGISLLLATAVNVSLFAGAAIGCPIVAWLAERYHHTRHLLLFGAFVPAGFMLLIIYSLPPLWLMFMLMLITGFCISPYILSFALTARLAPGSARSTCIGLTNCLGMATAPIFQMFVGFLMDLHHNDAGTVIVGHYFIGDYHFALGIFPILLIIAGIIAHFLKLQSNC